MMMARISLTPLSATSSSSSTTATSPPPLKLPNSLSPFASNANHSYRGGVVSIASGGISLGCRRQPNRLHLLRFAPVKPHLFSSALNCSAQIQDTQAPPSSSQVVKGKSVSVILLAGGKGKRMGASMPKQYLPLLGQPIALYSLYTFSQMIEVKEIIVVCDPSYKDIFEDAVGKINVDLKFALPGKERQDSVYSGLQAVDLNSELVCIHDSARPLVSSADVEKVLRDGLINGAAVLGVPVKATIKEADGESFVARTLDRKTLWEMQTPQVIEPKLLKKGFELVNRGGLEVTDDVSIVEHLKHRVYITEGSYTNIKVTTPDDMLLAERILSMSTEESPK